MNVVAEFLSQMDAALGKAVGQLVGKSIVQRQLQRLNKERSALTAAECKALVQNVINSVSLFVTDREIGTIRTELEGLFARHFA
jgi:hypothetical protein